MRTCGDCIACCTFLKVEFENHTKPARKVCLHVLPPESAPNRCGVHGQPCRPKGCGMFDCAWKQGTGLEEDRPNLSGVMLFVKEMNGGVWGFAMELEPGAVRGKGKEAVVAFANELHVPVIVTSYEKAPPNDTGDLVIVKRSLLARASQLVGAELATLGEGVKMYELLDQTRKTVS